MLTDNIKLLNILENACGGKSPSKDECRYMLSFDESSIEASLIRAAASHVMREKTENSAIILGQIGIDVKACPGGCKFCTFGDGHTKFNPKKLTEEELAVQIKKFNTKKDLYALFLMTMHDYDLDWLIRYVKLSESLLPSSTQVWINVGDTDYDSFRELKKAGVSGIYHVCRIGEGRDTCLNPADRIKTMENAIDAGLKLYTCCEPVGPEHTIDEIVDNIFIGVELGCTMHAAMRRVAVDGAPLSKYGQISELRLGQIVATVALASFTVPEMKYCGVHEPNKIAYISGANIITAESGANPRDNEEDTAQNRGFNISDCRNMLLESGIRYIRRGDESKIPLTLDYIKNEL